MSLSNKLVVISCVFGISFTVVYGNALQFVAEGFSATADTATWNAGGTSNAMTSVHAATNGWNLAVKEGSTVFFDNGISSPLGFPDSATNSVAYAFAVVKCAEASDHATLIDAPCSIRFIPNSFSDAEAFFYESQLTNTVALSINGTKPILAQRIQMETASAISSKSPTA